MSTETNKKKADKSDKIALYIQRTLCYIVLILLSILCLFSFYVLLINTTRSHPDIQKGFSLIPGKSFLVNMKNLLTDKQLPVLSGMANSLLVASGTAILSVYFSALTAYAIHAYNFRFKKLAFTFIMIIMMVPTQVSALGFIKQMSDMHLMNSFIPLVVPSIASPVVFFFIKQYMDSVLPIELVEAARIDGAHEFRIFNQIVLPLMKPAIAVQAIFTFVGSWNNYFVPALIIQSKNKMTVPILIATLRGADYMNFDMGKIYMMITVAIVPIIIVYLLLSKYIIAGVTLGGVKE